jgi:hypothetical protein
MHRIRIRGRMHGNRCNAEFLARALYAQRNLTSVGNQDFIEHFNPVSAGKQQLVERASKFDCFWSAADLPIPE